MLDSFRSITDVINRDDGFLKFRQKVTETDILLKFSEIIPELSKTVIARKVNKGTLFLEVENSVLKSELFQNQNLVINKVNNY